MKHSSSKAGKLEAISSVPYKKRKRQNSIKCKNCRKKVKHTRNIYCSNKCHIEQKYKMRYSDALKTGFIKGSVKTIRRTLLFIRGHKCELCKHSIWQSKQIPVVVDHIDGRANNNYIDNLRIICCNCDALLPTYKGRNAGNGTRQERRKRYADGKTY